MRALVALAVIVMSAGSAAAAPAAPVTVFLDRGGDTVDHDGEDVTIPRYGGSTAAWQATVACVRDHFATFNVDIVDRPPTHGSFITALVGGRASQLGYSDGVVSGVGPFDGSVLREAVVHVFSPSIGEREVQTVCDSAAHEIGHALGLDHTYLCGDLMSYQYDCDEPRTFMDVDAPCGEEEPRTCEHEEETQSSYARLAALVGLREEPDDDQTDEEEERPRRRWHRRGWRRWR